MHNLRNMTIVDLCEIHSNLYMGLWDNRLGEPPCAAPGSNSRLGLNDTLPIMLEIQKLVEYKELCRHRHVFILRETEEQFECWWSTCTTQKSIEVTKKVIKFGIVAGLCLIGIVVVKMIAAGVR